MTADRARLLRAATNAAVVVALLLAAVKLTTYWFCGSVALLASAMDSALDASASLLNALAVRYALRPPDADYRFGHGKSEALAGVAQALFISASGVFVIVRASARLIEPLPLTAAGPALLVMIGSLVLTLGLVMLQKYVLVRTDSAAIRADALHYVSDVASNAAALLALLFARMGMPRADPLFGVVIALLTLYGAIRIGAESWSILMDRELPSEARAEIERIVLGHSQVRGLHALRTRKSGATTLIQLHLELDPSTSLADADCVAHQVSSALERAFLGADVIVHEDPVDQPCEG